MNLKVRGPTSTINLSISPDLTYDEFKLLLSQEFKFNNKQEYDVMSGYPPMIVQIASPNTTLLKDILSNNDNIRLQLKEDSGKQLQGKTTIVTKSKTKSSLHSGTTTTSSSSSAAAASSIMNTSSSKSSSLSFGAKISDLSTLVSPNRNTSNNTAGSKRNTEIDASGNEQPAKHTRHHRSTEKITSEDDICEHLLNAINGGNTNIHKTLRRVFRNAVGLQYNATKAIDRLNAGLSGQYTISESLEQRILGTGESTKMDVSFTKEAGSRSNHNEEVDLLPPDVLVELLKIAYKTDQELLKPINLSKYSPRIFWSLIRRYGNDIHVTIRTLLASVGIDIPYASLLDGRKRELSEKAKANLEQHDVAMAITLSIHKKSRKMKKNTYGHRKIEEINDDDDDVIQENNNNNNSNDGSSSNNGVNDHCASSNSSGNTTAEATAAAAVVVSVIQGGVEQQKLDQHSRQILEFITDEIEGRTLVDAIISPDFYLPLLNYLHVTNSAEMIVALAALECTSKVRNAIVDMKINTEILPNIKSVSSSRSSDDDGIQYNASGIVIFDPNIDSSCSSSIINNNNNTKQKKYSFILSLDTLDDWISSAQFEIIHCIWRLLCGYGSERLRMALERLRIKTPMEMMIWKNIPHALLDGLCTVDCDIKDIRYLWLHDQYNDKQQQQLNHHHHNYHHDGIDDHEEKEEITTVDNVTHFKAINNNQLSVDKVRWMCDVCSVSMQAFPWSVDYTLPYGENEDNNNSTTVDENGNHDNDDDDDEEDYEEDDDDEVVPAQQWLYSQAHHPYVTRRVRLVVGQKYWEDGTVIAYLPPDETEPVALWKVM